MVDWNKVQKSHVIKTCRKVIDKWWGASLLFFDEFGNWTSNDLSCKNNVCRLLSTNEDGSKLCKQNYLNHLKHLKKEGKPFFYRCFAGLEGVVAPIVLEGKYVGAIVCCGLSSFKLNDAGRKPYLAKLESLGIDRALLDYNYNKLKYINDHSREYICDFIQLVAEDVISLFNTLLEKNEIIKRQNLMLENGYKNKYQNIIGSSPSIKNVFKILELVESSESAILIEGESGTGKELIAAAIHYNSPRKDKVFVIQNCAAFNENLLSSELFGHEKGSFTGATSDKKGVFELADGGTLFLDEIGDLDINVQAKLLRVLDCGTFYRLGGTVEMKVDVRIITATNKEMKKQVEKGLFREDLFFRINTISINTPPLRDRKEDIYTPPLRDRKEDILHLVDFFVRQYADYNNVQRKWLDKEVIELLTVNKWPGNVREFKNLIERLMIVSGKENVIRIHHLPGEMMDSGLNSADTVNHDIGNVKLPDALKSFEKGIIEINLQKANWNKTQAAKELGISRASLHNKIEQLEIIQKITL